MFKNYRLWIYEKNFHIIQQACVQQQHAHNNIPKQSHNPLKKLLTHWSQHLWEQQSQLRLQLQQSSHNDSQSSLMHSPNLLQQWHEHEHKYK